MDEIVKTIPHVKGNLKVSEVLDIWLSMNQSRIKLINDILEKNKDERTLKAFESLLLGEESLKLRIKELQKL